MILPKKRNRSEPPNRRFLPVWPVLGWFYVIGNLIMGKQNWSLYAGRKAEAKAITSIIGEISLQGVANCPASLYGSCTNSFCVSKSDIEVCLAIGEADMDKSKIIMKLADILQLDNLQNMQEEKLKQKQLLALLEKLICKEWPSALLSSMDHVPIHLVFLNVTLKFAWLFGKQTWTNLRL